MTDFLRFPMAVPFCYNWSGKFKAPNSEWMHLTRQLFDFELIVVTDGILYIADHRREYEIPAGSFLLMAPTEHQHGYRPSDCSFYWMHFSSPYGYEMLSADEPFFTPDTLSLSIPMYGILPSTERIIVLMKQLQDSDRRYGMNSLNQYLASAILAELGAQFCVSQKYGDSPQSNQLFQDVVDYINWHICENLKVSDIADYFGYNEKYLSTLFHKWGGTSMKQFILQRKMEHAKAELTDTNHSISQIGYNIGYNDPHNFTNAFKKITGLTPSDYRESYSKRRLVYS
ncbi:MAG: AraC family transcriptional regulator [Roseburia sp.]